MNFRPVRFQRLVPDERPPIRGAGDAIERLAKPIAQMVKRLLKADLENCEGCESRKQWLNERFPRRNPTRNPPPTTRE